MEQLLAHLVGDYYLQTSWMAKWKVRKFWPAFVHATVYTIPFLFLTSSPWALAVITGTHFFIDRYSIGRHVMVSKGVLPNETYTYEDGVKYPIYTGNLFLLYVVTDNTMHLLINYFALRFL